MPLPGLQTEVNSLSPLEELDWRKLPLEPPTHPVPTKRVSNSPPGDSPRLHLNAKQVCSHILLPLRSSLGVCAVVSRSLRAVLTWMPPGVSWICKESWSPST